MSNTPEDSVQILDHDKDLHTKVAVPLQQVDPSLPHNSMVPEASKPVLDGLPQFDMSVNQSAAEQNEATSIAVNSDESLHTQLKEALGQTTGGLAPSNELLKIVKNRASAKGLKEAA